MILPSVYLTLLPEAEVNRHFGFAYLTSLLMSLPLKSVRMSTWDWMLAGDS